MSVDWGEFTPVSPKQGGVDWSQFEPIKPSDDGQFVSGFKRAFQEVPGMAAGAAAYAADVVGADETRDRLLGYAKQKNEEVSAQHEGDASSITDAWDGKTGWLPFLANASGYVAAQALQSVATGGVGVLGAKMLAKQGIKELAEVTAAKAIAAGASETAAKEAVVAAVKAAGTKAVNTGAVLGAGAHNFGMELGSIYPDAVDEATKQGRELDAGDKFRVFASASLAAGVDTAGEAIMANRVFRGSKAAGAGILGRAAREVPAGMVREGSTEAVQTMLEHYGAGTPIADEAGMRDIVDSAGIGMVGGGLGGAASSRARRSEPTKPEEPPITKGVADIAEAPTVDDAIAAAAQSVSAAPSVSDRVDSLKAELSDRAVMESLRATFGDDGTTQFLNSLTQAGNKTVPMSTREKHLQSVEDALFAMRTTRIDPTLAIGSEQPALLGYDPATESTQAAQEPTQPTEPTQPESGPPNVIPMGMSQQEEVKAYVDKQRENNTPMAIAFTQAFDSGKIKPSDVAALLSPRQLTPLADRLAAIRKTTNEPTSIVVERSSARRASEPERSGTAVPSLAQDTSGRNVASTTEPVQSGASVVPAGVAGANDALSERVSGAGPTKSWVIREKATGNVVMETFDRKKVDALNTAKYEAVPVAQHLAQLNAKSKAAAPQDQTTALATPVGDKAVGGVQGAAPGRVASKFFVIDRGHRSGDESVVGVFDTKQEAVESAKSHLGALIFDGNTGTNLGWNGRKKTTRDDLGSSLSYAFKTGEYTDSARLIGMDDPDAKTHEWQKTVADKRQEFVASDDDFTPYDNEQHRASVEIAVKLGKDVPRAVLADYPDLAAKRPEIPLASQQASQPKQPPKSFRKKHSVTTQVFVEESGNLESREVDADTAVSALNEDISELQAFLKCIGA